MKPNELRDGNWIITKPNAPFMQNHVMQINAHAIANNSEHYNGIPLTEEWLLKFGFWNSYPTSDKYYHDALGQVYFNTPYNHNNWLVKAVGDVNITSVKYVHQLQNLYYVLTGEELDSKNI